MKSPNPKTIALLAGVVVLLGGALFYVMMPVAEVAEVRRGTAYSAVYGTVRIEPTFLVHVRAQNAGFIRLDDAFANGRGSIGKEVAKGQLLATIADETTARQLKQARADLEAANQRAALPLPSAEPLKAAEDNLRRLELVVASGNVPAVEYEKAKSEANRLRGAVETERIERDRNLAQQQEAVKKLEAQLKNTEIRAPIEGIVTSILAIDNELVAEGNELFTVASRKNYVRGEVNEEDIGSVKAGMKASVTLYAYRAQQFTATVSNIQPAADPETQRYTVVLQLQNTPDNLMAGMTGEMNIITGHHENVLLVPTRALLVDQVLIVRNGTVHKHTVQTGYGTIDFTEAISGVRQGDYAILSDQDKFKPGRPVRLRKIDIDQPVNLPK